MKRFFSLVAIAVLSVSALQACMKKSIQPAAVIAKPSDRVFLVMDTTQALLGEAEVMIGKSVYRTSWDGRLVLTPEQLKANKQMTVTCKGFEKQTVKLSENMPAVTLIALTPKPEPVSKPGHSSKEVYYSLGASRHEKAIVTLAMAEPADGAMYEEAAPAVEREDGESPRILPAYNDATAGKLTAGEVNDFAKWYFWPKVLDETHKQYLDDWHLTARERYTVQLMNKAGYPVANYPVNLTDRKGNTVFQAVTDNTGKAELWNGLTGPRADVDQPAWQTIVVDEPCEHSDAVDVCFVFDATGSMGDELRYLQAEMKDVISRASAATGGLVIRTGAVVYRDHCDEYVTRLSRLTEDITTTQTFIDKQYASGGGDYEEAIPEALMAAMNSAGWDANARARIAFLILDAPCHQDSATLALLHDQILNAAAQGIRIVPVVCSGLGESGELLLRTMALATNGTSFFLTDDSGIGNPHLQPTTDSLKVEHLNDMLVRTIVEFSSMPDCAQLTADEQMTDEEHFLPNPFEAQDLTDPSSTVLTGEGIHYLLDVSGKLLGVYEGEVKTDHLPKGVYFIKTFYDGKWHTRKILVR